MSDAATKFYEEEKAICYSRTEFLNELKITDVELESLLEEDKVVLLINENYEFYPKWQIKNNKLIEDLEKINRVLNIGQSTYIFYIQPDSALGGLKPCEVILAGRTDLAAMAAKYYCEMGDPRVITIDEEKTIREMLNLTE